MCGRLKICDPVSDALVSVYGNAPLGRLISLGPFLVFDSLELE